MKLAKRILLSSVALVAVAAALLTVLVCAAPEALPFGTGSILSDGETYSVRKIDAVKLSSLTETLPAVGDKETLLKLLKERGALYDNTGNWFNDTLDNTGNWFNGTTVREFTTDGAEAPAAAAGESGGSSDYAKTNEQVAGVNEGDIVKTDGQFIYALSGNLLRIVEADGADMRVVSELNLDRSNHMWGTEFYLMGDKLAVVGQQYGELMLADGTEKLLPENDIRDIWYGGPAFTVLFVYDITDRSNPVLERRAELEGNSIATRVIGNVVYLVTNKYVWNIPYDGADSPSIMPYLRDSLGGAEDYKPLDLDCVYYIPDTEDCQYLMLGALDVTKDDPFEPQAVLGAGCTVYMSRGALYIASTRYESDSNGEMSWTGHQKTDILRFSVSGTEIAYTGTGTVDGAPINQYSMDEYEGYFRIATTDWGIGTYVTVLDENLAVAGRTQPLAPDEQMQSMRFMGDMAYVVTFRNMDPLFTIDLSDPSNPAVLGELKIPGFSQYLHPIGDGLLLGIGRDTREIYTKDANGIETVIGNQDVGMKVSLFDVSDPANPREIDVLPLGEGWSEVCYNPRALMVDPERGQVGFFMESWDNRGYNRSRILILGVTGNKLEVEGDISASEWGYNYQRVTFIGNTLYGVWHSGIDAYAYGAFEKTGQLNY